MVTTTVVSLLDDGAHASSRIDIVPAYPCSAIADDFSITVDDIITWNSWIGSNCDTGLYAGLSSGDQNAVCVGVNSTAPTDPASSGPSTTTSASATMGPTQTGIISNCTKYYTVQSGDSCASVETMYAITFSQFYSWNPAGKCDAFLAVTWRRAPS